MTNEKTTKKEAFLVSYGGWYQRTGLHLNEIYIFFKKGQVDHRLSQRLASYLYAKAGVDSVTIERGLIDRLQITTNTGIIITYFEDGLYILETMSNSIDEALEKLKTYYYDIFLPSINHIFSRGAPLPETLIRLHSEHPYVIFNTGTDKILGENSHYISEIESKIEGENYDILQTSKCYLINYRGKKLDEVRLTIETLIFTNDFNSQLYHYLDIHREIWEIVDNLRDKVNWTGKDLDKASVVLDTFEQRLNLIENRINQMGIVFNTRNKYMSESKLDVPIKKKFEFEFSTLSDSLEYIKELMAMTSRYVDSSIEVVGEQIDRLTSISIDTLRLVTTLGVVTSLVGFITIEVIPKVTAFGFVYLGLLIIASLLANVLIQQTVNRTKKKVSFPKEFSAFEKEFNKPN